MSAPPGNSGSPGGGDSELAELAAAQGLTAEEYGRVVAALGRNPNPTELGIFAVMWSEHCSYKSSKHWLKALPVTAPWVICGPGENAGVIDIGDGDACVFKMESHNHPSFIEPRQGAATGVGGIMRDVFTMGARPVANMNALRFGSPAHPKTRRLLAGVVAGIGGYGNCVGVPTVGGELNFHPAYDGNILVNAMCVGLARADRIFYAAAAGIGNPVVYAGSRTGRDGIHGATMASAEFDEDTEERRPTVQVGDPFMEKLLLEACLELMATDAIIAIQDMGAAGLTCSSVEMADKGGVGLELDLDATPLREAGMSAHDIMLSESQERMLMVLKPGHEAEAQAIFDKWGVECAVVGRLTDSGRLTLRQGGDIVGDIPIRPLVDDAPCYRRPWTETPKPAPLTGAEAPPPDDCTAALLKLVGGLNGCARRWVYEQYDHTVMADTIQPPGGDAAVVRVHGADKALAIATDATPRYCVADPFEGGKQAVAETWRNITAVGATPLAVTDCLNFGNPERPEIMGQLVGCIRGMAAACQALDYPVVSGNVSLYNETEGAPILPTPAIGGVGLLRDSARMVGIGLAEEGLTLALIGESRGHLGRSLYLMEAMGCEAGPPPPVDLDAERRNGDFVRGLIQDGMAAACHDLSDGGLAMALAEMCMAGGVGAHIRLPDPPDQAESPDQAPPPHALLFGEDQARYCIALRDADSVFKAAAAAGVPAFRLGVSKGAALTVDGLLTISIAALRAAHETALPDYMSGAEAGAAD